MALASTFVAMAGVSSAVTFSSQPAIRCNADPSSPSTSSVFSNVKFPIRQLKKSEAALENNVSTRNISSSSGTERPAILDPALQCANLMWFKGSYNTQIFVSEDEPADSVVRRFRKAVMQAGVIPECRRRRFFETPQDIAKRKLQAAQRRNKSRRFTPRPDFGAEKKEGANEAKANDDDDYWGYLDETS
ncbi:unnamed protein product [Calypogeia fissa]